MDGQPTDTPRVDLIASFVQGLNQDTSLDAEIVSVIADLHATACLDNKNLIKALARQREEWDRAQAA